MGIKDCWRCCGCCYCFKGKYKVNDTPLQQLPKPKEADEVEGVPYIDRDQEEVLIIRRIDPCITENGTNHHTLQYDLMHRSINPQLVVRRGQPFKLELQLSRPYVEQKDGISFFFTVQDEENAKYGQGTLVGLPLLKSADRSLSWNVVLISAQDTTLTVEVTPAPDCVVSKWHLDVDTKIIEDGAYSYSFDTAIYILYNPWCPTDQVYLKDDEWRQETVMNDVGLIWRGTINRMRPCIWKYDQFEENVLDCSLYLIHKVGKVQGSERGDPVVTSRAISAAVNSVDDNGAVMGNWSEDYSGGIHPTKWIGSKEILQKYFKKKTPVKYGQCWVFSGVLATVCRAVGIPARTITNYSSAHDTQSSLTVDFFLDQEGKIMEELNTDSVWNFHVWNEAWMQRPDLGREYGGWQAIDATPQEPSDGLYRVGPASVAAVKQGDVTKPYDNKFLYAEVNADKVYWRYTGPTQPLKLLNKDTRGTGKLILTKAPGRFEHEIITNTYKYPEKTEDERASMLRALRQSQNMFSRYYLNEEFNDIHFSFELNDDIKIGETFNVILNMRNRGEKDHDVSVILRVDVTTYKGKVGDSVKKEHYDVTVRAGSLMDCKLPVTYDDYKKRLIDQASFGISCLATVKDTKYEYYAQDEFRVRKPDIVIDVGGRVVQGKENQAEIYLVNPLPVPLTKCEFTVEGPGLDKPLKLKVKGRVGPGERATATFVFRPLKVGSQSFGAKFVAKELDDVDGFVVFMVEPLKEENGSAPA